MISNKALKAITTLLDEGVARIQLNDNILSFSLAGSVDLKEEFPGAYEEEPAWSGKPLNVSWDEEIEAIAVGTAVEPNDRHYMKLEYFYSPTQKEKASGFDDELRNFFRGVAKERGHKYVEHDGEKWIEEDYSK